ncbi:MAG: organoarsenical effux MFS transporter ArsJ [Planctomycetes bacterium]|nr:organoarsenical effux MFS transporter ArsJ [Planctomycetota bacterium]
MNGVRDYATITGAYWVFTLTDGALRMLVLFHLHALGFSPLEVVSLFVFYELFGVVTNFVGGWIGARFGLERTLFAGLILQIAACGMLAQWAAALTVPLVMTAQAVSGIAKDLTKMSAKSYIKLVVPAGDRSRLMRWVAVLTGSKNALKGVGFFLGGLLLQTVGFARANQSMAGALAIALVACAMLLPAASGKAGKAIELRHLLTKDPRINWLSAARMFLFGSRDVWFVFALPVFLNTSLGWTTTGSGAFLACWVIGYGIVQAASPRLVAKHPDARHVGVWTALLLLPLGGIASALVLDAAAATTLTIGLALFGIVFAANSAMHSYLIVHYAEQDRVSLNVGFYYSANAMGRLVGTVLSGATFQWAGMGAEGLVACIGVSAAFVVGAAILTIPLRRAELANGADLSVS